MKLAAPTVPTFYFAGVTTGGSAARRVFPRWMEIIGRPEVALQGVDFPLHDDPAHYRAFVDFLRTEPLALGSLVWMEMSYRAAPYVVLFRAPPCTRWVQNVLMPIALLFFVCSVSTKNPTVAGQEKAVAIEPRGIVRITRHPMLWSFALWGLAHIVANGDVASLVLFAGITALAILGMVHIDSRRRVALGDAWTSFAEKTSVVPFVRGNVGKAIAEIGAIRIIVALVVFGGLLHLHKVVIGMSPLP